MQRRKDKLILWVMVTHLALVCYGACGSPWASRLGRLKGVWRLYGEVSAAGHGYGFFAPRVGAPTRIRVRLDNGPSSPTEFVSILSSTEGRMRLSGFEDGLRNTEVSQERRDLAASLAAAQFDASPNAHSVTILVECLDIPTIKHMREGAKAGWFQVSLHTFRREKNNARPSR